MDIKYILSEFREFTSKGNFFDLAIAFVVGTAFNKAIQSLVNDVILPLFGSILRNIDFNNLFISLNGKNYETLSAAQVAGAPTINYGVFINNFIVLSITVWAVFLLVRLMNRLRRNSTASADAKTRECPYCIRSIPLRAIRCPECTSQLTPVGI